MEIIRHGLLKSGTGVFKAEWHDPVSESSPRTDERSFKLISRTDNDLVVSEKPSIKDRTSCPTHSSMIWSINGVGKLSLGQALFKS